MNKVKVIDESNFSDTMKNVVEPFLVSIRKDGRFLTFDNKNIHYEAYIQNEAKANVIILHGFCESAEKFREMSYYFLQSGYNVFALDHRGHGFSDRIYGKSGTVKAESFDDYVKDLDAFIKNVVNKLAADSPIYVYSHSLGSTIALLYAIKNPVFFDKLILSSPMICPNTGMPVAVAKILSSVICKIGGKGISVPGRCEFNPSETYEMSDETSKSRFNYYHAKRCNNMKYQTQGPSFGWVKASLDASEYILRNENCRKLKMPILMFQPQTDRQVLISSQNEFATKVQKIKNIYVRNTKHEIFASSDNVLQQYLTDIFAFLQS